MGIISQGGLTVTLAGQDITASVDEYTIDIKDTLGQSNGSGSGAANRVTTCSFNSKLGPVATAVGSGTHAASPTLVRNGEIVIYDRNGNRVFGGYATKYTDQTDKTTVYTKIEAVDYWAYLDRIVVNQIYSGQSDAFMIKNLLANYAPWIDTSRITTPSTLTFSTKNFRNVTLLAALQSIVDITGFAAWVDSYKRFFYMAPSQIQTAPFGLSTAPDFRTTYQFGVDSYEVDDNAVINRVTFYGGKRPSGDFKQDISPQANGSNTTFVLAYYPRSSSDGKIHVKVNGAELVVGTDPGSTTTNQLKSAGGICDVLVNSDAHTLIFNVAPASGATVFCTYRYEYPLTIVVADRNSYLYFGTYLDGTISDETVVDQNVALQRARILLAEQSMGLGTLKCRCWQAGLQSGQLISIYHSIRQINASFIIQEVDTAPVGNGQFCYTLTLGAWNWGVVDVFKHLIAAAQPSDDATDETTTPIVIQEGPTNVAATLTLVSSQRNFGGYYARASASLDGHDAYPGFFSITS